MTQHIDSDSLPPTARTDRSATLVNRAEFALALALGALFRIIGVDASSALAGAVTRRAGPLMARIHRRGLVNIKIAFPDATDSQAEAILRDAWENLGRTTAEFAHLPKFDPDAPNSRVDLIGRERIDAVIASGRPAIFVSGHFANWEVMSVTLHALGVDYGVIYRAANNPLIDRLIIRERARVMSRRQIPKGKRGGRDMIDAIRSGASLAMLVDQKLNTGGIPSPLFGKPAMTAPAAARLSLKYAAPVIPIEIDRTAGAHFRVTVHAPIAFVPSGDASADTQKLTDLINLEIETMIRARPGQWLWLHRRWSKEEYAR